MGAGAPCWARNKYSGAEFIGEVVSTPPSMTVHPRLRGGVTFVIGRRRMQRLIQRV